MSFVISALAADRFTHLSGLTESELERQAVRRLTADAPSGYPCRVSLRDARVGEALYLLNFVHHDWPSPFRASHAIYVIEGAVQSYPLPDEVPDFLRARVLSLRGFSASHDLVAADVASGTELEEAIGRLLAEPAVDTIHVHNARQGCYLARVDRAAPRYM